MNSRTLVKSTKPHRSKADRLREHVDIFANGHVFVPSDRPFTAGFVDEHLMFEGGGYADQVDCTSQYLSFLRESGARLFAPKILASVGPAHPTRHPMRDPKAPPLNFVPGHRVDIRRMTPASLRRPPSR